jgi:hypothetical protein
VTPPVSDQPPLIPEPRVIPFGDHLDVLNQRNRLLEKYHALAASHEALRAERDDYRFWNERVRTCAAHTQDVAAPVGDCLICNMETERAQAALLADALRQWPEYTGLRARAFDPDLDPDDDEYASGRALIRLTDDALARWEQQTAKGAE